jgi:hypothetical protein
LGIYNESTLCSRYVDEFDRSPLKANDIASDADEERDMANQISASTRLRASFDMRVWQERVHRDFLRDITSAKVTAAGASPSQETSVTTRVACHI